VQETLELVYRVDLPHRVEDFYVGEEQLRELKERGASPLAAREQLLVLEEEGETSVALFIEGEVLRRLEDASALDQPAPELLEDLCLLTEGVSHFVYLTWKAARGEPVTQLELELQAEIDKYLTCYLAHRGPEGLRESLFWRVLFRDDLADDEHDRYQTANRLAGRYCEYLEKSILREGGLERRLPELRRFYRLTHPGKLGHIAAAA